MSIPEASLRQARSLIERGKFEQGWQLLQQALQKHPDDAGLHNFAGALYQASGQLHHAAQHLQLAVKIQPDLADAWHNLALLYFRIPQLDDARRCYARALSLDPDNAQLYFNLSFVDEQAGDLDAAIADLRRAREIDPGNLESRYRLMYLKRFACDWSELENDTDALIAAVNEHVEKKGEARLSPYGLNIHRVPDQCHDACAGYFAEQIEAASGSMTDAGRGAAPRDELSARQDGQTDRRLRLGYMSADFCSHAVGGLIHGLFAHHDRTHFHVTAYALSDQDDAVNQLIRKGVDVYRELATMDTIRARNIIVNDQIDILVDLGGYTKAARPEILALRPAEVQVSWLGYLNTMQAGFVDHILVDETVIPPQQEGRFNENIIRLPGCFLPATELPSGESVDRTDLGLPEHGVVYCSFNHSYKIEPDTFDAWMRILIDVPDSVLWLYAGANLLAEKSLAIAAEKSGVDPVRLVFAPRVALSEHLARLSVADLFLDTFYYNAGATAIAAVQAGVPIVTMSSGRILGRMGASINHTLGLDMLTCKEIDEYVSKAVCMANEPDQLARHRKQLAEARPAIFDLQKFARKLEVAFAATMERSI